LRFGKAVGSTIADPFRHRRGLRHVPDVKAITNLIQIVSHDWPGLNHGTKDNPKDGIPTSRDDP
jgi:hypothetical protein